MKYLGIEENLLCESGAVHTAREIDQQPDVWLKIYRLVSEKAVEIRRYLEEAMEKVDEIILTGAGTSAFIGIALAGIYKKTTGHCVRAIATTDLVTHPAHYFSRDKKVLLVSFARSGNSPESCAAVELAEQLSSEAYHLIITCNKEGALLNKCSHTNQFNMILPEETNDRSLAMTSSFTGMLLAGLLLSKIDSIDRENKNIEKLVRYGERILSDYVSELENISRMDFDRAVYLGSGPLLGTAIESHLKLQELTDGRVICKADSFLGLRHGPKAVINGKTVVVALVANDPYVLKYENDRRSLKQTSFEAGDTLLLHQQKDNFMKGKKIWMLFALTTTLFWGLWGAFTEIPEKSGFPATLIYVTWSVTMIIPAVVALRINQWKLDHDKRSVMYGAIIGFLGSGGQLILFTGAIKNGPAYLIFPIISLSPLITIIISLIFLKEKAGILGWIGIIVALIAIPLLSYQDPDRESQGLAWLIFALLVFLAWGIQAFFMKLANKTMKAESIFFYMMLTSILLSPVALAMTDFTQPINWGIKGPGYTFVIQLLNAVGALCLVYAFRYGKAIIVSPMTNAIAPVITVVISLIIYQVIPHTIIITGMVLAIISIFMFAFDEVKE